MCVRASVFLHYIVCVKWGFLSAGSSMRKGWFSRYQSLTVIKTFPLFWSDALTFFRVKKGQSLIIIMYVTQLVLHN